MPEKVTYFKTKEGFCPYCGRILPLRRANIHYIKCVDDDCSYKLDLKPLYGKVTKTWSVKYNEDKTGKKKKKKQGEDMEAPTIDRECQECGNPRMMFKALQLRSADEGQTCFYTCPKCGFGETENS